MLTDPQIQYLYNFCEKKGVRYYDLQSELVDHMSEAVDKLIAHTDMSFEDALEHTYKGFGVTGFSRVIAERETALWKNYNRTRWVQFKKYFTYPRVIIAILILMLLNASAFIFNIKNLNTYYSIITISAAFFGLVLWLSTFKSFKKPSKKLMVLNPFKSGFNIWGIAIQIPNLYFFILREWNFNISFSPWHHLALCCFSAIIILLSLAEYDAYKNTYINLKKQYPLAFTRS